MKGSHKQVMAKKEKVLNELNEKLDKASIIIFTDYRGEKKGLSVKDISELRKWFREQNVEYKIAKNTLISRALHKKGIEGFEDYLKNPTALVIGYGDPVNTTKTLLEFGKEKKSPLYPEGLPIIKGAYMEGRKLDNAETKNIAKLPSKMELMAKLLSLMNTPAQRMMGVLSGPGRNMLNLLDQWNKSRQEDA